MKAHRIAQLALLVLLGITLSGCDVFDGLFGGGEEPGGELPALTGITVNPTSVTLDPEEDSSLIIVRAQFDDDTSKNVPAGDVTWTSASPAVATVSDGVITGVAEGTTTVTATYEGESATVSVTVNAAAFVPDNLALLADASITRFTKDVDTANGDELTMTTAFDDSTLNFDAAGTGIGTFASYPAYWNGAIAWLGRPDGAAGNYDLSGVETVQFYLRSSTIQASELAYFVQWEGANGGEGGEYQVQLGTGAIDDWTLFTIDLTSTGDVPDDTAETGRFGKTAISFFTENGNQYVETPFALSWFGSAAAEVNSGPLTAGEKYEISDIAFLDAEGNDVDISGTINYPVGPTAGPTDPTDPSENVIPVYTDFTFDDSTAPTTAFTWDSASPSYDAVFKTPEDLDLGGNNVVKASSGILLYNLKANAASKTTFNLDVWTADPSFKVKLVDFAGGSASDTEHELTLSSGTDYTAQQWSTVSVPLSDFTGMNFSDISQILIIATTDLWFDNIYFSGVVAPSGDPVPLQVAGVGNSGSTADTVKINWGAWAAGTPDGDTNADGWDESLLRYEVVYSTSTGADPDTLSPASIAVNADGIPTFPVTVLSSATSETDYFVFVRAVNAGGNGPWSSEATVTTLVAAVDTPPTAGAGTPLDAAADVISLYNSTGTYTDIAVGDWSPGWGQAGSISDYAAGSDTVKKLDIQDYQGVDFTGALQDITGKTTLHLSYATTTKTDPMYVYIINTTDGEENYVEIASFDNDGDWHSVELDFSTVFAGFTTSSIGQLKFTINNNAGTAGIIYLDNIYFK